MKSLLLIVYVSSFLIAYLPAMSEAVDCNGQPSIAELEGMILDLEASQGGEESPEVITILNDPYYTCQAQGTTNGTSQELSVIVQYSPDGGDPKTRQFEVLCQQPNIIITMPHWDEVPMSLSIVDNSFDYMNNEVRQNCSSCTSSADNDYHCEG